MLKVIEINHELRKVCPCVSMPTYEGFYWKARCKCKKMIFCSEMRRAKG